MKIFDEDDIISTYSRDQAVADSILVELFRWNGRLVMATTHIYNDFEFVREELVDVWNGFKIWKEKVEPNLPEEERLFCTYKNDKKVWVIEDSEAFTIMYPEDY